MLRSSDQPLELIHMPDWCLNDAGLATARVDCAVFTL
jgi:hypothetical protein